MRKSFIPSGLHLFVFIACCCLWLPLLKAESTATGNFQSKYDREWQFELTYDVLTQYEKLKEFKVDGTVSSDTKFGAGYWKLEIHGVHISEMFRITYGGGVTVPWFHKNKDTLVNGDGFDVKQHFYGGYSGTISFGYRIIGSVFEFVPKIQSGISLYSSNIQFIDPNHVLTTPIYNDNYDPNKTSYDNNYLQWVVPVTLGIDVLFSKLRESQTFDRWSVYLGLDLGYAITFANKVIAADETKSQYKKSIKKVKPAAGLLDSLRFGINYEI